MSLTTAQNEAVTARGNVVVVAGAGTGKTSTLVERCLNCLVNESPHASLEEILIVTFTEAAAAEIRQRIRARLEGESKLNPENPRWQEQLALFETAHIGTLHGFCLQLVRQHFYELELDPQLSVLSEEEARLLAEETLSALLEKHYAGKTHAAAAVRQLIQVQGGGSDQPIRRLVLRIHHYTQTLPNPRAWFDGQFEQFARPDPTIWRQWLVEAMADWRERWLPFLKESASANPIAANCSGILSRLDQKPDRSQAETVFGQISAAAKACPEGKKGAWIDSLKAFFEEAEFLSSVSIPAGGPAPVDPLAEDWGWIRSQMTTLLQVAREFSHTFGETKRELGVVDFHDLEQHALSLLWDAEKKQPTEIARQWQEKLRFVFVDEYQDINAAQDKIIAALSRNGARANRFLVGDVKQSIYRFRLANPYIFQGYVEHWNASAGAKEGRAIPLVENFRSREGLLNFVNAVFSTVMREELGGVRYDEDAQLRFGAREKRDALSLESNPGPCVELHLRLKGSKQKNEEDGDAEVVAELLGLAETDKEARGVALRLRELKAQRYPIWDDAQGCFRPVEWGDMAILLRSPAGKSESYAKEFSRLNIPLLVERSGFYQATEISDLLSLLKILDNPLQDLPLLAVLHSPLVGLTVNELATIRLAGRGSFWATLVKWREMRGKTEDGGWRPVAGGSGDLAETGRKVDGFLAQFSQWRRLARQVSLSRCLDAILSQTYYATWLLTQPRGEQRHANVQRLLALAQQFDRFRRQGLFRFLCFIDAQQLAETEPDVAAVSEENSVRLMSIHQSKGLEFAVVALADLAKPFNVSDLRADIILDEEFGLCPQIKPPHTAQRYPSLPHWLASRRQRNELLGEEIRLLYVGMTRAKDRLILSANLKASQFEKRWRPAIQSNPSPLSSAHSYSDWLGFWFAQNFDVDPSATSQGENTLLSWMIHDDARLAKTGIELSEASRASETPESDDDGVWEKLRERLAWEYGFKASTVTPAKASVTALRRRAAEWMAEEVERGQPWGIGNRQGRSRSEEASDVGTAHHKFLQLVSLDHVNSREELEQEAARLQAEEALTPDEIQLLDFHDLAAFWESDLGRQVRSQVKYVRRELVFTARFSPAELAAVTGETMADGLSEEFVVVQGVADLAVVKPSEIWLIDFKTDRPEQNKLDQRVREYERQLQLYARALCRVYQRPVTSCWLYFLALRRAIRVQTG